MLKLFTDNSEVYFWIDISIGTLNNIQINQLEPCWPAITDHISMTFDLKQKHLFKLSTTLDKNQRSLQQWELYTWVFTFRYPPLSNTAMNSWKRLILAWCQQTALWTRRPFLNMKRWRSWSKAFSFFLYCWNHVRITHL